MQFSAIYLAKNKGIFDASLHQVSATPQLREGDVRIAIEYSSLNYKDALAINQGAPIVRSWPMVAGIDGAGTVVESAHPDWQVGDKVIHQGWGAGEKYWGCLAQQVCVSGAGLVRLPPTFSSRQAMAIGTAGYTAMLCVLALERNNITPATGDILVTGASGGLGSLAVALLAGLGYRVVASTAKLEEIDFLRLLGAAEVIDRTLLSTPNPQPLQKARWAAVIDAVGSHTLANALAQTTYGGSVIACGLAQGMELPTTVAPFILRQVQLIGIDSSMAPIELRKRAWQRLTTDLAAIKLETITREISLAEVIPTTYRLLSGHLRGRIVVNVNA